MANDRRAASIKAAAAVKRGKAARSEPLPEFWAKLAAEAEADGYGIGGPNCGTRSHEVKSVAEVLARLRERLSNSDAG